MPLEAIIIAVDNSEYTRNGDYAPSRFLAQNEAVSYLANSKLQENQESSVGLMSMAGSRISVLISPGREPAQLLNALAKDVRIGGRCHFVAAIKTAQLALKNRQNKNQKQRIIMFVASPIECDVAELVALGKSLKKNNVALDVVNFGSENSENDNTEKLEQLVQAVNTSDNSHLVSIPPGPHIFADLVLTSAIMASGGGGGGGGASLPGVPSGGASGGAANLANLEQMDPEMAMVIRMSMEEERQRQQKAAGGGDAAAATTAATAGGAAAGAAAGGSAPMEEDEDALLAQAIALSMQENADAEPAAGGAAAGAGAGAGASAAAAGAPAAAAAPPAASAAPSAQDIDLAMQDPDFLNSLLAGVPGAEGAQIDNLLDELTGAGAGSGAASGSTTTPAKPSEDAKKEGDKKEGDKK